MAGRSRDQGDVIEQKVFTSVEEVEQAITKLGRRLDEMQRIDPKTVRYDDPSVKSAAQNFSDTVLEV